ncbi:MAG: 23S rRNA (pseudouridine(1915)-N(3))-methyltransferase RlmH [Bacteroidales bacterium]|nr:23S rRNA (pseudouridine(1915)-N(3))-methyltransferase RlmH [Bacteroidales bacterium]
MKIKLICVGKTDFSFVEEGMKLYCSRLKHYCKFSEVYIPALKGASSLSKDQIKEKEGELILREIGAVKGKVSGKKVVLLDERGESLSSEAWAAKLEKDLAGEKEVCFVIGGAYGFSKAVYDVAGGMLSLSRMTFSHQIVRLIFLEQLYRAMTIMKGEPYHHA